jgi:hypothetical protein
MDADEDEDRYLVCLVCLVLWLHDTHQMNETDHNRRGQTF